MLLIKLTDHKICIMVGPREIRTIIVAILITFYPSQFGAEHRPGKLQQQEIKKIEGKKPGRQHHNTNKRNGKAPAAVHSTGRNSPGLPATKAMGTKAPIKPLSMLVPDEFRPELLESLIRPKSAIVAASGLGQESATVESNFEMRGKECARRSPKPEWTNLVLNSIASCAVPKWAFHEEVHNRRQGNDCGVPVMVGPPDVRAEASRSTIR